MKSVCDSIWRECEEAKRILMELGYEEDRACLAAVGVVEARRLNAKKSIREIIQDLRPAA